MPKADQCLFNAAGLAAKGDFTELMTYSTGQGYKPDYMYLLQRMMMDNPEAAVNLAKMVARQPGPPIELNVMADLFLQRNAVREATAFLLDVLQDNKPENDKLQTKVQSNTLGTGDMLEREMLKGQRLSALVALEAIFCLCLDPSIHSRHSDDAEPESRKPSLQR